MKSRDLQMLGTGAALGALVAYVLFAALNPSKYELHQSGSTTLKIDKKTGETWFFAGQWVPIKNRTAPTQPSN